MRYLLSLGLAVALTCTGGFRVDRASADSSDVVIAGAAGFAVGTLFGSAVARPYYRSGYYGAYPPRAFRRAHYRPLYGPRVYSRTYYFNRPYNDPRCGEFRCR